MILLITVLLIVRYYLNQREEINSVATRLRDDISADAIAAYDFAYGVGVNARDLYDTVRPRAISLYEQVRIRFDKTTEA